MSESQHIPILLELLFGAAAEAALAAASPRLLAWAAAFDAWLEAQGRLARQPMYKQARQAWRRLLAHQPRLPWAFTPADLAAHVAWMQARGLSPNTILNALSRLASFYRWCAARGVDPACGPYFNPVAAVPRPRRQPVAPVQLLTLAEVQALLSALRLDPTPLGCRALAFFLARLHTGVSLARLQRLQWGQLELVQGHAWVRWRPAADPVRLPPAVWDAIHDWLRLSGRLDAMQPASYVFVPAADGLELEPRDQPARWLEGRPLSARRILDELKRYGRFAGLPPHKLTLQVLRRTAIRLKLDQVFPPASSSPGLQGQATACTHPVLGSAARDNLSKQDLRGLSPSPSRGEGAGGWGLSAGPQELRLFLDSQEPAQEAVDRLKWLPALPPGPAAAPADPGAGISAAAGPGASVPSAAPPGGLRRLARPFRPGEGLKHGFYAGSQPSAAVRAVLQEDIRGLGEEIEGLRRLARLLVGLQEAAAGDDILRLGEAYTLAATRLAQLIAADRLLGQDRKKSQWVERVKALQAEYPRQDVQDGQASPPVAAAAPPGQGELPELDAAARQLAEEIATARAILRRTLALACDLQDAPGVIRLADIYGKACSRLVRLLRAQGDDGGREAELRRQAIDLALAQVMQELNIHI